MTLPTIDDVMRADRFVDRVDDHHPMSMVARSMLKNELAAVFDEVRRDEREACAKLCAEVADRHWEAARRRTAANGRTDMEMRSGAMQCFDRIKGLGSPRAKEKAK